MKVSRATWGLAALATAVGALAHADRWRDQEGEQVVTDAVGSRPVFDLRDEDLGTTTIELAREDGTVVMITPSAGLHLVVVDGDVLGPVDVESLDGLWGSLSMARTLRSVHDDAAPSLIRGKITVQSPSGTQSVVLGSPTPDGVGVYGAFPSDETRWVVESELATALEPKPLDWVARRLLPLRASDVARVDFHGRGSLARGLDGLWRSTVGSTRGLLSTAAVEGRLDALLATTFDPVTESAGRFEPWFAVVDLEGRTQSVQRGGACGRSGRLVDRGQGLRGCVDRSTMDPWDLPGSTEPGHAGSMVEARLLPHRYGRVLAIEQTRPSPITLRRRGGGWILADPGGGVERNVDETEVFGWYERMQAIMIGEAPTAAAEQETVLEWIVHTDSTQSMRLQCGLADGRGFCRRDRGMAHGIQSELDLAGLRPEIFASRTLTQFAVHEVMAVEIRDLGSGVRQSIHRDLGTWRLDAPRHPAGDLALDEVAVEALLTKLATLRAEQWVADESFSPTRVIRLEFRPGAGSPLDIEIESDCRISVPGKSAAALDRETCVALQGPLLFRDPLRGALHEGIKLDVMLGGTAIAHAMRQGDRWTGAEPAEAWIGWCEEWRALALESGPPPTPVRAELQIVSGSGRRETWLVGRGWTQIQGEAWYYAQAEPLTDVPSGP